MNNPVLAESTTLIDNDQVRVTRFDFAPGAHTGWHRHEYDYVITNDNLDSCYNQIEKILSNYKDAINYMSHGIDYD